MWKLYLKRLFILLFLIGFFGGIYWIFEVKYLGKRYVLKAVTQFEGVHEATIKIPPQATEGEIIHEVFHSLMARGQICRDNPSAAAVEYYIDYLQGNLKERSKIEIIESIKSKYATSPNKMERVLAEIDQICSRFAFKSESLASYREAVRLAALCMLVTSRQREGVFFLLFLGKGAPSKLALKCIKDHQFSQWVVLTEQITPYDVAEKTLEISEKLNRKDLVDFFKLLFIRGIFEINRNKIMGLKTTDYYPKRFEDSRSNEMAEAIGMAVSRARDKNFKFIHALGNRVNIFTTGPSSSNSSGGSIGWLRHKKPSIRINLKPNNQFKFQIKPEMIDGIKCFFEKVNQSVIRGVFTETIIGPIEVGTFERNKLVDNYITIQWSNLMPNEADTTIVLNKKRAITSVLITLNINCDYFPVIATALFNSLGLMRNVSIVQRPFRFFNERRNVYPLHYPASLLCQAMAINCIQSIAMGCATNSYLPFTNYICQMRRIDRKKSKILSNVMKCLSPFENPINDSITFANNTKGDICSFNFTQLMKNAIMTHIQFGPGFHYR